MTDARMTEKTGIRIDEFSNAAARGASAAALSVLVPFHGDDPAPLVEALAAAMMKLAATVEIVLIDDASPGPALGEAVRGRLDALAVPARLLVASRNLGRAAARNRLAAAARGRWLLFLDADMGVTPDFLARWLDAIETAEFDAAFGGYDAEPAGDAALALHAALALASDIRDAEARRRTGPTAFCTSNLLVRADVMRAVRFDESFTGWGWEDVDWAVRAARSYALDHVDNPARHGGWQTAETLLEKFRIASANYARLLGKHPQLAALPGARAANLLRALPGQGLVRGLWARAARADYLPMRARTLALKLWRASWAAEAIR